MDEKELDDIITNNPNIINYLDWERISWHVIKSEEFIRKYKEYIEPGIILQHIKLSENFLREMIDVFDNDWYYISKYQDLSYEFITDFKDKLNWRILLDRYKYLINKSEFKKYVKPVMIDEYNRR